MSDTISLLYCCLQCYDSTLTSDSFITALKMSTSIEEVQSILAKVGEDMSRARAKDTGGVDGTYVSRFR